MSYILDALRKSDQLRQRGAAPMLLLGQTAATAPKQPTLLYYGVFALVLLAVGIGIGWLRPWQAVPAPAVVSAKLPGAEASQQPAPQPDIAPKPGPSAQTSAQNALAATQAVPAPASAAAPAKPKKHASVKPKKRTAQPKVAEVEPKNAAAPAPGRSTGSTQAVAAPLPVSMAMADLPLAIQQELPPMSISVHAYSDKAADRLVGINNRLLHEGQDVAPGLRLEHITPNGMILSFKGYKFRRGVH